MSDDEQAIRDVIDNWARATAAGDIAEVMTMMTEDAIFLTPGQPPMGRDGFAAGFLAAVEHLRIEANPNPQEIDVSGNLAYCWNHIDVRVMAHAGGAPNRLAGYTLTIFRKQNGKWLLARDANLLAAGM
jgi:uncharacterized protein (TIGR02246 family)